MATQVTSKNKESFTPLPPSTPMNSGTQAPSKTQEPLTPVLSSTSMSSGTQVPSKPKESFTPVPSSTSMNSGTQAASKKKESFTYFGPSAENVLIAGDFTGWAENPVSLKKQADGSWRTTIPLDPGVHEYRFLVDGQWQDDEKCPTRKPNGFGAQNCVREVT